MFTSINEYLKHEALNLPRSIKKLFAIILDVNLIFFVTWLSLCIRFENLVNFTFDYFIASLVGVCIAIPIFILMDFYKSIFRYSNFVAILILSKAMFVYGFIFCCIFTFISIEGIPRSIGLIQPTFLFLFISTSRWFVKKWLGTNFTNKNYNYNKTSIIIYGSGKAGQQLASNLSLSNEFKLKVEKGE